jgi:BirA family biotin operon repressor/biotin-[acetyl-CoA-carboxylase] ligase
MGDPPASPGRWRIRRFEDIDSTNRYALDAARAGEPAGLVVVADHQTAGRGRRGRAWTAPAGSSLLVSVLLTRPSGRSVSTSSPPPPRSRSSTRSTTSPGSPPS